MSWFKRLKDWAAEEVLSSTDLNAEFDNIAEALNSVVAGGSAQSSAPLSVSYGGEVSVAGTDKTLVLERASLVMVNTWFDLQLVTGSLGEKSAYVQGYLTVDGANEYRYAEVGIWTLQKVQTTIGCSYMLRLGAGTHSLKLKLGIFPSPVPNMSTNLYHAGYSYFALPDPEP